jgi:hypothetical protein
MLKLKERETPSIGTLTIEEILDPIKDLVSIGEFEIGAFYKHKVIWLDDKVEYAHLRYEGPHKIQRPNGEWATIPMFLDVNRELSRSGLAKEVILAR